MRQGHDLSRVERTHGLLTGYKRAFVLVDQIQRGTHRGQIVGAGFRGHRWPLTYPSNAVADCASCARHADPEHCRCGFHAVKRRAAAARLGFTGARRPGYAPATSALLEVVLWGDWVIEGLKGYRANRQLVQTVDFPQQCWKCGRPAQMLEVGMEYRQIGGIAMRYVNTVCENCRSSAPVSMAALHSLLALQGEISIGWDPDMETEPVLR